MLQFPKQKTIRDKRYLEWMKTLRCCIKGCNKPHPDPHHVRRDGHGSISLKPSDKDTLPLCHAHHVECHNLGKKSFASKYELDYWLLIDAYNQLYERATGEKVL